MSGLLYPLVRRYACKRILEGVLPRDAALDAADNYGLTAAEGLALADELEALPSAARETTPGWTCTCGLDRPDVRCSHCVAPSTGQETAVALARPFDREAD